MKNLLSQFSLEKNMVKSLKAFLNDLSDSMHLCSNLSTKVKLFSLKTPLDTPNFNSLCLYYKLGQLKVTG